ACSPGWLVLSRLWMTGPPPWAQPPESAVELAEVILPIFQRHCLSCHGAKAQKGSLRLDTYAELLRGGDSGTAVVPRDPASSPLLRRLTTHDEETRMPLAKAPLPKEQVDLIHRWIAQGAPGGDTSPVAARSDHWSFQPIHR